MLTEFQKLMEHQHLHSLSRLSRPTHQRQQIRPKVSIKFDVADTLEATTSGGACILYLNPPVQTVNIHR